MLARVMHRFVAASHEDQRTNETNEINEIDEINETDEILFSFDFWSFI